MPMPPTTETVHLSAANPSAAGPVDFVTATTRHSGATSRHSERSEESLFDCGISTQISTRAPLSC